MRLVILSGASGSGKTTLAPRLAGALGLPLLCRDDIKEGFYDGFGRPADRAESQRLGRGSYDALYRVVARQLDVGVGAVVESNFGRGHSEASLRPLAVRASAAIVHCRVARATLIRRALARLEGGAPRHAGHVSAAAPADLRGLLADPARLAALDLPDESPPDLGVPTLVVDTTDGYAPELGAIVAWVRDATVSV